MYYFVRGLCFALFFLESYFRNISEFRASLPPENAKDYVQLYKDICEVGVCLMGGSVCSPLAVREICKVKGLADEQSLFCQKFPMDIRIKASRFKSQLMPIVYGTAFWLSNGAFYLWMWCLLGKQVSQVSIVRWSREAKGLCCHLQH